MDHRTRHFLQLCLRPGLGLALILTTFGFINSPQTPINAQTEALVFEDFKDNHSNPDPLPVPATVRYRLDSGQSRFIVRALVGGLLSAFGHNHTIGIREFSGEATLTTDTVAPASLQMTIQADSLAVLDKVKASDKQEIETKMRNEVLETGQHPSITFKSTNITANKTAEGQYDLQIWGDVTLHGVSKSIWFKGQMTLSGNSLRAKGDFALRLSEFKIKPVSAAGGTVKVKDEVKFSFDIVGVK
jgi:polyisoprenoid-binding protein YceI